jgi:hypothetical protein
MGMSEKNDQKQMVMLEALSVLEKRVRRELENIELFLRKAREATKDTTSEGFVIEQVDYCFDARERIKTIEALKKEVLSKW